MKHLTHTPQTMHIIQQSIGITAPNNYWLSSIITHWPQKHSSHHTIISHFGIPGNHWLNSDIISS